MTDRETHTTITFESKNFDLVNLCPRCHRNKPLGTCEDGCKMCQSCYTLMHGGEPLPSDTMGL